MFQSYIYKVHANLIQLKKTIKRLAIASTIIGIKNRPIVIWFIPLQNKRLLPKTKDSIITSENINAAYTYTNNEYIYIYRDEEFPKVMLHEMIHKSPLHIINWDTASEQRLYDFFKIHDSTFLIPNEAVVETWANILQCCFVACEHNMKFSDVKIMLKREADWALHLASKMVKYGYKPNNNNNKLWYEKTHSFSYIIFRSCFLHRLDEFIAISSDSIKLTEMIINKCHINQNKNKNQNKNILTNDNKNSMRMTIFGDF